MSVDYVVVVNLLPQNATKAEKALVLDLVHDSKQTILQSADDAQRLVKPGKPGSKVVVWDAERWPGDIVAYLGVPVELKRLIGTSAPLALEWPTDYRPAYITSRFGDARPYGTHEGVDVRTGGAGKILSATSGLVAIADNVTYPAYGNCVVVKEDEEHRIFYGHLASLAVFAGQAVQTGSLLGIAGATGNADGVHLHFGVKSGVDWIDPEPLLVWPSSTPPSTSSTLKGLHMRAGGPCEEWDFECVRIAGIQAAKLTTENPPETIDRLVALGIRPIDVVVRLFADMSDRVVTPAEFCDWMNLPIQLFMAKGVRYFEIHNEPNLPQEGLGQSWNSGAEFAVWYRDVLMTLSDKYPAALLGFPGLSPQPNTAEFVSACDGVIRNSDWLGVHCYWTDASLMSHPEHGGYWQRFATGFPGKELIITEFSNPSSDVAKSEKGMQYWVYYRQLPVSITAAFCFISSSPAFPHEAWVSETGIFSEISYKVGA